MYPLRDWKKFRRGYRFGSPTFYSKFHLGLDVICPTGTPLYAWDNCTVKGLVGTEGGNTAWLYTDGKLFRFLHLKERPQNGKFNKGQKFAVTNNTGKSTGPHVHIDISKNGKLELNNLTNFIDPEKYFASLNSTTPSPVVAIDGDLVEPPVASETTPPSVPSPISELPSVTQVNTPQPMSFWRSLWEDILDFLTKK